MRRTLDTIIGSRGRRVSDKAEASPGECGVLSSAEFQVIHPAWSCWLGWIQQRFHRAGHTRTCKDKPLPVVEQPPAHPRPAPNRAGITETRISPGDDKHCWGRAQQSTPKLTSLGSHWNINSAGDGNSWNNEE